MLNVPASKEYRKFMKTGYVRMPDGLELIGDQIFTKRLHARQLCGMYSEAKLEAFRELVQSTNDRLIVFYNFKEEARRLMQIANDLDRPWGVISGDQKLLAPYENHEDSITFIQYQAGAMGLNLQKANKVIYFTLPERSDLFEQSKARIHRIGQNRPCFYWLMVCGGSVEEIIHETLLERKDFTDDLFEKGCEKK
jgi:SNF2 family DNA or RNA helicase